MILASDLCCKSSFSSLLKMKTLKALCNKPGETTYNQHIWKKELKRQDMSNTYLGQCWSWGGSFSLCPLQSSGHSHQWECTSRTVAAPASHPGDLWLFLAFWWQTEDVLEHCCVQEEEEQGRQTVIIHIKSGPVYFWWAISKHIQYIS